MITENRQYCKDRLKDIMTTINVWEKPTSQLLLLLYNKFEKIPNFHINDNLNSLLWNTKNEVKYRKLPFQLMFIDTSIVLNGKGNIAKSNEDVYDMNAWMDIIQKPEGNRVIRGIFIDDMEDNIGITILVEYNGTISLYDSNLLGCGIENKNCVFMQNEKKLIKQYICNVLDFINQPEVDIIKVERSKEQNLKRIKRGKLSVNIDLEVKIHGRLKIYLDKLISSGKLNYSHKFWVRGHFRTLRNEERYKDKTGTKIWIPPYIKGEGILTNKEYDVEKVNINEV